MVRTLASATLLLAAASFATSFLLPSCCNAFVAPALLGGQLDRRVASTPASLAAGPSGFEAERDRSYIADHRHHNDARPTFANALATAGLAALLLTALPNVAYADGQTKEFKFPPIDFSDKQRCILKSSSMGQANAARDALFDLRQCQLAGVKASGYDLSGAVMTKTDASKANFREAYFSKGYLRDSNFDGADFSNAIVDRATFSGSNLRGAIFANAVLTGTSFGDADVEGADFTDAAIGIYDLQNLCKNPTLKGENPVTGADTRLSAGCKE